MVACWISSLQPMRHLFHRTGRHPLVRLGFILHTLTLAGIDDDTQGEVTEIVWGAELDARRLSEDDWPSVLQGAAEDPEVFSAYLRTIKWNTETTNTTAFDSTLVLALVRAVQ